MQANRLKQRTVRSFLACSLRLLPAPAQLLVQFLAELRRQLVGLARLVKRDGFANVVHDDLARIAAGHVLLEFLANSRINRAVHVFVQHRQKFFTLHRYGLSEPSRNWKESYSFENVSFCVHDVMAQSPKFARDFNFGSCRPHAGKNETAHNYFVPNPVTIA
jgi:hypothetical protein